MSVLEQWIKDALKDKDYLRYFKLESTKRFLAKEQGKTN